MSTLYSFLADNIKAKKKANIKNRYNQVEYHMGNWQTHKKHHTQESGEASSFPAGDHKARHKKTNMK